MSRFENNFQGVSFGKKPDRIQSGKVSLGFAFKNNQPKNLLNLTDNSIHENKLADLNPQNISIQKQ